MTRERCGVDFRPKLRYKCVSLAPNSEGNSVRHSPHPGSRAHSARETQLVHLLEVVCRRDDLPLSFDLANSTQQELPKPKDLLDGYFCPSPQKGPIWDFVSARGPRIVR